MHLCPLEVRKTEEITQTNTKNKQRADCTPSNNDLSNGMHATITWITTCIILSICGRTIVTAIQCSLKESLTFVSSQKCVTSGVVIMKQNQYYCYFKKDCASQDLQNGTCTNICPCPNWTKTCSFHKGKLPELPNKTIDIISKHLPTNI